MQNGSPDNNGFTDHHMNGHCVGPRISSSSINASQLSIPDSVSASSSNSPAILDDLGCEDNDNNARPIKKRKLTDGGTTPTTLQTPATTPATRRISPPWKKIAVDGPTSFVEGGRRKSSRTNFVPLELQPPTAHRQTRAAIQKTYLTHSINGASIHRTHVSTPPTSQPQINGKGPLSSGKSTGNPASKSPVKASPKNATTPMLVNQSHSKKLPPPSSPITSPKPPTPLTSRRSVRTSEAAKTIINGWATKKSRRHGSEVSQGGGAEINGKIRNEEEENDEDDDDDCDDNEDDDEDEDEEKPLPLGPSYTPQRLKLRVRMPEIKIQHPGHVALKRQFASFRNWFEYDASLVGDDTGRMTEQEAKDEAQLRRRIVKAGQPGGVLSESNCSAYLPEPHDGPPQLYLHWDFLLAQAEYFQKLMQAEQRSHRATAKRIALAAAAEWKRKQPKTEEEIQQEYQATLEAAHKRVLKQLVQKFELAASEVERRRRQRWEEEQQRLGKQALNKVLEQSTQLLDRRRMRTSSDAGSIDDEDEATRSGASSLDSETDDEDNMSSSQSNSADEDFGNAVDDDDEDLTQEELHRKYSMLSDPFQTHQNIHAADPITGQRKAIDIDPGGNDSVCNMTGFQSSAMVQGSTSLPCEMSQEREVVSVVVDEVDEILMDDSAESTDMDDDTDESTGQSPSDQSDEDSESGEEDLGLLGFFSKQISHTESHSVHHLNELSSRSANSGETEDDTKEVTIVADASQFQTPSASNSEEIVESQRDLEPLDTHDQILVDQKSQRDDMPNHSSLQGLITDSSSVPSPALSITVTQNNQLSISTTPLSTHVLKTPVPSLLRGTLREYQHFGLDWLAGLYANGTNGILADEMGLGKTIQTIALLAHLALEHEIWGPHLIVVPTSVILNWEMEFKKFLPGFKVLTYYGSQEERKRKRIGWMDDNKWNIWITSYQIVLADNQIFRRRGWHYMVLDEAHNIKNFRSQRWQTLLGFRTHARLLLTGTPLQNNLTELWSLLFFLMPTHSSETGIGEFAGLQEFSDWFRKPVEQILEHGREVMDDEARAIVAKLHRVLRPFLLRRLKADVEKQMPGKYEHVVYCRLSKRQRYLYDGFMSRAQTKEILASGNYLTIINCLMQLRKVCNHPDLFETRQIVTSFSMPKSAVSEFEIKELLVRRRLLSDDPMKIVDLNVVNLCPGANENFSALDTIQKQRLGALGTLRQFTAQQRGHVKQDMRFDGSSIESTLAYMQNAAHGSRFEELCHASYLTSLRSQRRPLYSYSLMERLRMDLNPLSQSVVPSRKVQLVERLLSTSETLKSMVPTLDQRSAHMQTTIQKFGCVTPNVVAADLTPLVLSPQGVEAIRAAQKDSSPDPFHEARMRLSIAFPDKRLLQYDCGKLQKLDALLRTLQAGGHRALIFTQMTRVLDILEQFLNIHGHRYLRLDGSTKIEQRQILTDRFNSDTRILAFILSSRSGGLGINLTGADTVIFYDLDWNPAMDKQCQDRCHRIGQTRDVHIYRFVSEYTIEANILKKSNQKRMLDDVIIQEGEFTTDYFDKISAHNMLVNDPALLDGDAEASAAMDRVLGTHNTGAAVIGKVFEQAEDEEDIVAARIAEREMVQTDAADFEEKAAATVNMSSGEGATPKTPLPQTPRDPVVRFTDSPSAAATPVESATPGRAAPAPVDDNDDADEEDDVGHIDNYMLRFVEWQLRDVPIAPAPDKSKSKKSKKAGEGHRSRR